MPGEKRIVRFKYHDAHKHQHQHRRDQNCIRHGPPLPGHVHEDPDNQACLQNHEREDQRPSEISMEMEVIDQIGTGAEDKQPPPDHEIQLNRVLLSFYVRDYPCLCLCMCHVLLSPMIEKVKDEK